MLIAVRAQPAAAHFLWVDVQRRAEGPQAAVYFNEDASPGSARLAAKIAPTKAWVITADGQRAPLDVQVVAEGDDGQLSAKLPAGGWRNIAADYEYGVFKHGGDPVLLHYYAQHIEPADAAAVPALARAAQLPLTVAPRLDGQSWLAEVTWQNQPASDCQVVVQSAAGDEELATDKDGVVHLPAGIAGNVAVRARKIVDHAGKKGEEAYGAEHHFTTLTLHLPDAAATVADASTAAGGAVSADKLLAEARDARAMWDDFPGFAADLTIAQGREELTGRIKVSPDLDVELSGFGDATIDRPRQILESLVQHRSGGGGPLGHVSYVEEESQHPLGRMIRFEDDKELNSAYRVRNNIVTEVNRAMGPMKFTISVLDVYTNPEGKYLPTSFNVSFWDKQSGRLTASESHVNEWLRVGEFDLPERVVVFRAEDGKRHVVTIDFAEHRLLDNETKKSAPAASAAR